MDNNKTFIDSLSDQEKLALEDLYPANKYTKYPDIDQDEWRIIKNDYKDKVKYYMSIVPDFDGATMLDLTRKHCITMYSIGPAINSTFITKNFPRILPSYDTSEKIGDKDAEKSIPELYQKAKQKNPDIKVINILSLRDIEKQLFNIGKEYMVDKTSLLVNTTRLVKDLQDGKIYFKFDDNINTSPLSQIRNFTFMSDQFQYPQGMKDEPLAVLYNRCLATFMILYYMRESFAAWAFLKSMGVLLHNFNGLLQTEEMLALLLSNEQSTTIISQELVKKHVDKDFPTLVDMKLAFYKFVVMDDYKYFCDIKAKTFYMNRITYYTFSERFEGMRDPFIDYKHSMVYSFRLLIPDEENFKLAKSKGFIDSRRIDWQFWRDNIIKYEFPTGSEIARYNDQRGCLVEKQYILLRSMKTKYYNFFNNVITDYYRKLVYEPVSLIFNISTIVFAFAGVFAVLLQANVIPSLPSH